MATTKKTRERRAGAGTSVRRYRKHPGTPHAWLEGFVGFRVCPLCGEQERVPLKLFDVPVDYGTAPLFGDATAAAQEQEETISWRSKMEGA